MQIKWKRHLISNFTFLACGYSPSKKHDEYLQVKLALILSQATLQVWPNMTAIPTVFRNEYWTVQSDQLSSFEIITLCSRASKKINLYSNHTENKLQTLRFANLKIYILNFCLTKNCLFHWPVVWMWSQIVVQKLLEWHPPPP